MKDIAGLSDFFDGKKSEELVDVRLIPNNSGAGAYVVESLDKFEELIVGLGNSNSPATTYATITIPKGDFALDGATLARLDWNTSSADNYIGVSLGRTSSTSISINLASGANPSSTCAFLIGRKKRYATTNLSVTIPVNSGSSIAVNSRYEIPASALPASFLNSDGTIKSNVNVHAEVYNESGVNGGETGWSRVEWTRVSQDRVGVSAYVFGANIVVQSAAEFLYKSARDTGSAFGGVTNAVSAARCRVIATLAGEAYTVQTA